MAKDGKGKTAPAVETAAPAAATPAPASPEGAAAATDIVTADAAAELACVSGVSLELFKGVGETMLQLKGDMPLEQRKEAIRALTKQATQIDDKLKLVLGETLYETNKNGYWKEWTFKDEKGEVRPYASFDEYTQAELQIKRRSAFYLIDIYETFIIKLKLPKEVLGNLEWSKAKELTKIIDKDNWKELLDKIEGMTVKEVIDYAASVKAGGKAADGAAPAAGSDDAETMVKLAFKFHPAQAENVKAALELAKAMTGSEKAGHQLDLICSDFLASSCGGGVEGSLTKLDFLIKSIERGYGVKLTVSGADTSRYGEAAPAEAVGAGA